MQSIKSCKKSQTTVTKNLLLFDKLKLLLICFKAYSTIKNNYSTKTAIKHPKTVTKLSKPIKQPIIITQQPNKIKVYTESKAADRMLQLRHILTKNAHDVIQLKLEILKSMMSSLILQDLLLKINYLK